MSEIFEKFRDTVIFYIHFSYNLLKIALKFVDTLKILSNEDLFETFDNDNVWLFYKFLKISKLIHFNEIWI